LKTIAIIANKKHKKAVKLKDKLISLLPQTYHVYNKITERQGHATELAFEAVNENADFIIAAGGDGTINEVVNGVMKAGPEQREKVIVGLFPHGTGNDFARTAQIPDSAEKLAKSIIDCKNSKIDLGLAEYTLANDQMEKRYFDNIAEIGVGAKTVEIVNKSNKTLGSTLTFFLGVLKAFAGYKRQSVRIKSNDFQWVGKIVEVCAANGCYFGSGIGIAPGASLNDGKLSFVIVGNMKIIHFLKYLPSLRKLKYIKHPEVHYLKLEHCEIISEKKYPLEMDGENVGFTPFSVRVVPSALNFLK
jgi:YegS/Rv2252/BmrU family lipid kinase